MKIAIAVLVLTVSSAAQMTNATLLALDRAFAKVTTTEHFDGWMKYMMDDTVIFWTTGLQSDRQWQRANPHLLSGIIFDAGF